MIKRFTISLSLVFAFSLSGCHRPPRLDIDVRSSSEVVIQPVADTYAGAQPACIEYLFLYKLKGNDDYRGKTTVWSMKRRSSTVCAKRVVLPKLTEGYESTPARALENGRYQVIMRYGILDATGEFDLHVPSPTVRR